MDISIANAATPAIQRLADRLQGRRINPVIGQAVANATRAHLAAREQSKPNKQGWPRQHFWAQLARSVYWDARVDAVSLRVAHVGAAQRYYGGTIRPVRAKMLTIPAAAEAYGRRAREFNNLICVRMNRRLVLVEAERTDIQISRKTGKVKRVAEKGGKIMFWLVPRVVQQPDPEMLPSAAAYTAAIETALTDYLSATGT